MFKGNPDKMRPEPSPERVYALCRMAQKYPGYSKKQLNNALEPLWLNSTQEIFTQVLQTASELDLLKTQDEIVSCCFPESAVQGMDSFRKFVVRNAMSNSESTFFLMTQWYLAQDDKYFSHTNVDLLAQKVPLAINHIDDSAIRGWRFWISFFGIGVLHNVFVIPNMYLRIKDALEFDGTTQSELQRNRFLPITDFVSWLKKNCPEAFMGGSSTKQFYLALSNGLRLLHDEGLIELKYEPDSGSKVQLYRIDAHPIVSDVSAILIRGEKYAN